jgi:hypothetical protein
VEAQAEVTKVTIRFVMLQPVIMVDAKPVIPLTVWEHASKTPFTLTGLAMVIAMMVHTFLRTTDMVVLLVLQFISTALNLTATVATVHATTTQQAHAVLVAIVS